MWDLQRNGGSVPATTERILSGRGLDAVSHAPVVLEMWFSLRTSPSPPRFPK